jgi:hypothetical protein
MFMALFDERHSMFPTQRQRLARIQYERREE